MSRILERFADLQARQLAGTYTRCPRCNRDIMKKPLEANVRSRISDIWICESCGEAQADRERMNVPDNLYCWLTLQPHRPASDFKTLTCAEAWKRVCAEQADTIRDFRRRFKCGEPSDELHFEALETLPGLDDIWFEPFRLVYKCADGSLHVHLDGEDFDAELVGGKSDK